MSDKALSWKYDSKSFSSEAFHGPFKITADHVTHKYYIGAYNRTSPDKEFIQVYDTGDLFVLTKLVGRIYQEVHANNPIGWHSKEGLAAKARGLVESEQKETEDWYRGFLISLVEHFNVKIEIKDEDE